MKNREDIVSEIIRHELSRYRFLYSYQEKQMIKNGDFKEVASKQLKKVKSYSWIVVAFILIFSGWGIYQFINFGNTENTFSLFLGLCMWIFVVICTHLFTREIVAKQRSMEIIVQLLSK